MQGKPGFVIKTVGETPLHSCRETPSSRGQVSTGPGTPLRTGPAGAAKGQAGGRVCLARSPFTFSARIRPPRSRRETAMAQMPRAEVAARYVTCSCTRTTEARPRVHVRQSHTRAGPTVCARILGGLPEATPLTESTNPGFESERGPPPGQILAESPAPPVGACPPCPDLTLNSGLQLTKIAQLEACPLRFWFDLRVFCVW